MVAGLFAAHDPSIAGIVLISGLFDLAGFIANPKSMPAKLIAQAIAEDTGGGSDALRARSITHSADRIKASALILNGAKDDRTDPEQARQLAAKINAHGGKARVIVYPEYGHQIPIQARDEVIGAFIESLLRK